MADVVLVDKVQDLSDLELATLLCLTAREHCIIGTEPDALDDLVHELKLIASNVFGLSHAVVDCSDHTTLDDFANSLFSESGSHSRAESPVRTRQESYFLNTPNFRSVSRSPLSDTFGGDNRKIANVIIAKNLDEAPKQIQIQTLELLRTKRIFTHTSVQNAPKMFLFIALVAGGQGPRLTKHLNDYILLSHFHDPEDGFPNLEDLENDSDSISSVVKKKNAINDQTDGAANPLFSASDIAALENNSSTVTITAEIHGYLHDIVAFLRMHRAVNGGISPAATKHFEKLVKCLAPLHGVEFVTPSLVALAAKKVYAHRIQIVTAEKERSIQWGSDVDAVREALADVSPDFVIEDVLGMVDVPL